MTHAWRYFRAGGTDQVLIESAEDLHHLRDLDQKRWVALACPTRGLEFDDRTLDLIDTDRDGRIRAPELMAACEWALQHLRDPQPLLRGEDRLRLDALADTEHGRLLAAQARRTLETLETKGQGQGQDQDRAASSQKTQFTDIGLAEIRERQSHLAAERFNGDGIVTVAGIEDEADRVVAQKIHDLMGGSVDAGGQAGISEADIHAFFEQAQALRAWHARGEADCGSLRAAAVAVQALREKVDDFFARCRLAAYDAAAVGPLNAMDTERLKTEAAQLLTLQSEQLRRLPIAPVAKEAELPLDDRANPAWREALHALREHAVRPLLQVEGGTLDEAGWLALKARVQRCSDWLSSRPSGPLATLGMTALEALLPEGSAKALQDRLLTLVQQDRDAAPQHAALNDLEKLLLLQRDLLRLTRNFVSFEDFYAGEGAIFQAGTLFLDGRACTLTVEVADAAKHAVIAGLAKSYLAYCECVRLGEKKQIVAVVSAGDVDFLFVGRNGLFYDRRGRDWDARIIKIIENPISVGQAFLSPYKKLVRLIEEQVAKRAAAGDATQQGRMGQWASRVATADHAGTSPASPASPAAPAPAGAATPAPLPPKGRVDVGTVAALGVALGSISTVIVGVFGRFVELGWWIPVAVLGIVLSISGPSMLIAWLKLRQRSLGPILDASGWAINNRMRLSVKLGGSLTSRPRPVPAPLRRAAVGREPEPSGWWLAGQAVAVSVVVLVAATAAWVRWG